MKTKLQKPKKHGVYILKEGQFYLPLEFEGNEADAVVLHTKHASIVIDATGLTGEELTWHEAMQKAAASGKMLPDRFEALEITNHRDELNKVFRQIGGQEISGWYWTRDEYSAANAWSYSSYGYMHAYSKGNSLNVRAVTATGRQ